MVVTKGKSFFNLWDTNGRRADVINALSIYLKILNDLSKEYPNEKWAKYPSSIKEFEFYKRSVEASPEVFEEHSFFDKFIELIGKDEKQFYQKDESFGKTIGLYPYNDTSSLWKSFDVNIENRARHYTSNLVRMGFATKDRIITEAGHEYLFNSTEKDELESILPLRDLNIILLRQMLKLRIFSEKKGDGTRTWYSPIFYAIKLLSSRDNNTKSMIKKALLTANPYEKDGQVELNVPTRLTNSEKLSKDEFKEYFRSRKSNDYQDSYYEFYSFFFDFYYDRNSINYKKLLNLYFSKQRKTIDRTFFCSHKLDFGKISKKIKDVKRFLDVNKENLWLKNDRTFNEKFYDEYIQSGTLQLTKEYGDTLFRVLTATGIFNFSKALPELVNTKVILKLLSKINIDNFIFGECTETEYTEYEVETNSFYNRSVSLIDILGYTPDQVQEIVKDLKNEYGEEIQKALSNEKNKMLEKHIEEKYPKEKIKELLSYFQGSRNDKAIKSYVNSQATVPTIYEYIVAIAWYYIADKNFSIYDSLNLTLDGNLEPLVHASGGAGDIVINYHDRVVMLEVTLMNKAAQKRGEWEPVLRHSINLKAENKNREVTTIFVADELDFNTINIWRAVAVVPLQSTTQKGITDNVYIMPFTNENISFYLDKGIHEKKIIDSIRESYDAIKYDFDPCWRDKILEQITS